MKIIILLYPIFFLFYFSTQRKCIRMQWPNKALWAFYLSSSIASTYLVFGIPNQDLYKLGIISIIYNCWMFGILLKTNEKISLLGSKTLMCINPKILFFITWMLIALGIPSFISTISNINVASFIGDILTKRQELGESEELGGIIGYISFFSKSYWLLSLVLSFYYLIAFPKKILLICLLLISSLTRVVYGLSHAGRGDVLIYLLVAGMLFLLLHKKMRPQSIRVFKILGYSLIGLLLSVFLIISIVRFGSNNSFYSGSDTTTFGAIIKYFGLGFANFSQYFNAFWMGVDGGASHFPFIVGSAASTMNVSDRINVDFDLNTFSTSIGSLIFDIGIIFTTIFIYVIYYFAKKISRRTLNIFTLFYAAWIYSYLVEAIFYFSDIFTGTRVLSLLLIVFFDLLNNSQIRVHK